MRKIPPKQSALASAQIPTREVHEFKYTFFCLYILVILREWEGREKEQRESMCGCLLRTPNGDLACNPGMCPDWESSQRPFGLQADTQSIEPHQPGHVYYCF